MKSIPRLVAGTAVILAAVLTTSPVTAGIADFVLNPGQPPVKRAAPALSDSTAELLVPVKSRGDDRDGADTGTSHGTESDGEQPNDSYRLHGGPSEAAGTGSLASDFAVRAGDSAGLVAHTAADAQSRVSDLANDLQTGVDAGEYTQEDADRVLSELSSYIKGERTWPERVGA
ncbi:hypothetical protein [Brevibacterium aurantiacum]|uniref:Uncharacterized protein n=1 Tax=Brevibacterium aurantiacum TaxID=273384 RepID=A0A556CFZ5_BREAU|nr:hypothetical protein [Brevibacterium aurantiacum]TSI15968.1 hypothetical protein FO013_10005 [Brevibacterium aurantiacum]